VNWWREPGFVDEAPCPLCGRVTTVCMGPGEGNAICGRCREQRARELGRAKSERERDCILDAQHERLMARTGTGYRRG
jgi:hypothetical protein